MYTEVSNYKNNWKVISTFIVVKCLQSFTLKKKQKHFQVIFSIHHKEWKLQRIENSNFEQNSEESTWPTPAEVLLSFDAAWIIDHQASVESTLCFYVSFFASSDFIFIQKKNFLPS